MTEEKILEGNKLIAEFMQLINHKDTMPDLSQDQWKGHGNNYSLKFHSSWDWLIPVVRKIADMVLYKEWKNLNTVLKRWNPIIRELQNLNIEGLWFCVTIFIKWYNLQNPSSQTQTE